MINAIPTSSDSTPTISWSPVTGAARYDVYISTASNISTAVIRDQNVTATSYTTSALPVGNFRVWVRAINAAGTPGTWSTAVAFTIVNNESELFDVQNVTMMASLGALTEPLDPSEVTVSLIPARIVSDSSGQVAERQSSVSSVDQPQAVAAVVEEQLDAVGSDVADEVMSNWDDAIWAEESAVKAPMSKLDVASSNTDGNHKPSVGWLAGLAMLPPALRRRKKSED